MKSTKLPLIAIGAIVIYGLTSCGDKDRHADHADHKDHADQKEHLDGDHDGGEDHGDHEHEKILAGPNGGRLITSVEPHAEFWVKEDGKVQITFVDDALKAIPAAEQSVSVIAGDRSNPTRLAFTKSGDVLLSDKAVPAGNDFPVVVQIKTTPSSEIVREKFNLNLEECPTCDNKEYACICDHHDEEK